MSKQRWVSLFMLIVLVPIGFFTKFYSGPVHEWISNSLGGLLYEIFWCLVFYFMFPKSKPFIVALIVFLSTCLLEFLQLWHPPLLDDIRTDFIGRTIIGNAFNWMDFPYYIVGTILGYVVLRFISKIEKD